MEWREVLTEIERNFGYHRIYDWKIAIDKVQKLVVQYPDNVELIVRYIYMLHNILVEEEYPESEHDSMAKLLEGIFSKSYNKYSNNSEYLFFIGKILYIAEWYFGLNDELKPLEKRLAFQIQKKASEIEPNNVLYEWACLYSKNEEIKKALNLSEQLLLKNDVYLNWLKTKGFPGRYLIESVKYCHENYKLIDS